MVDKLTSKVFVPTAGAGLAAYANTRYYGKLPVVFGYDLNKLGRKPGELLALVGLALGFWKPSFLPSAVSRYALEFGAGAGVYELGLRVAQWQAKQLGRTPTPGVGALPPGRAAPALGRGVVTAEELRRNLQMLRSMA